MAENTVHNLAQHVFNALDADKSGFLEVNEFITFTTQFLGDQNDDIIIEAANSILDFTDTDSDGKVDLKEWITMLDNWEHSSKLELLNLLLHQATKVKGYSRLSKLKQKKLTELFCLLDANDSGHLEMSELSILANALNFELAVENDLDQNQDHKITLNEWLQMMDVYHVMSDDQFLVQFEKYVANIGPKLLGKKLEVRKHVKKFLADTKTKYSYSLVNIPNTNRVVATFGKKSLHVPVPKFTVECLFIYDKDGIHFYIEDDTQPRIPSKMAVPWSDSWLDALIAKKKAFAKTTGDLKDPWTETRTTKLQWGDDDE